MPASLPVPEVGYDGDGHRPVHGGDHAFGTAGGTKVGLRDTCVLDHVVRHGGHPLVLAVDPVHHPQAMLPTNRFRVFVFFNQGVTSHGDVGLLLSLNTPTRRSRRRRWPGTRHQQPREQPHRHGDRASEQPTRGVHLAGSSDVIGRSRPTEFAAISGAARPRDAAIAGQAHRRQRGRRICLALPRPELPAPLARRTHPLVPSTPRAHHVNDRWCKGKLAGLDRPQFNRGTGIQAPDGDALVLRHHQEPVVRQSRDGVNELRRHGCGCWLAAPAQPQLVVLRCGDVQLGCGTARSWKFVWARAGEAPTSRPVSGDR
jgi:hypothetical protein